MRQDIMMILDASISVAELRDLLKGDGYSTLIDKNNIKVWESGGDDGNDLDIECGSADFYRYEEFELNAIKAIVCSPQLIYVSFRNKQLAERVVKSIADRYVSVIDDDHGSLTFRGNKLIR
jgi:hypothetical protein